MPVKLTATEGPAGCVKWPTAKRCGLQGKGGGGSIVQGFILETLTRGLDLCHGTSVLPWFQLLL
jgi:hypothetical protein